MFGEPARRVWAPFRPRRPGLGRLRGCVHGLPWWLGAGLHPSHARGTTHEAAARQVLSAAAPEDVFSAEFCLKIAGPQGQVVLGPSWHGFVDVAHFQAAEGAAGERVEREDPELEQLRQACGEKEWSEAGFSDTEGLVYGLRQDGQMVAAGNMTEYRGMPADVGVITHPGFRGKGLARRVVSHMTAEQLPTAGIVRYRALQTNQPSLAVASSLGFVARGENLAIRLKVA